MCCNSSKPSSGNHTRIMSAMWHRSIVIVQARAVNYSWLIALSVSNRTRLCSDVWRVWAISGPTCLNPCPVCVYRYFNVACFDVVLHKHLTNYITSDSCCSTILITFGKKQLSAMNNADSDMLRPYNVRWALYTDGCGNDLSHHLWVLTWRQMYTSVTCVCFHRRYEMFLNTF